MAVFQVEGAAVRRQLTWDCTDGLIGIGIAADLFYFFKQWKNL